MEVARKESFCLTEAASRKSGALARVEDALFAVEGHQTSTLRETSASPVTGERGLPLMEPEPERRRVKLASRRAEKGELCGLESRMERG